MYSTREMGHACMREKQRGLVGRGCLAATVKPGCDPAEHANPTDANSDVSLLELPASGGSATWSSIEARRGAGRRLTWGPSRAEGRKEGRYTHSGMIENPSCPPRPALHASHPSPNPHHLHRFTVAPLLTSLLTFYRLVLLPRTPSPPHP